MEKCNSRNKNFANGLKSIFKMGKKESINLMTGKKKLFYFSNREIKY